MHKEFQSEEKDLHWLFFMPEQPQWTNFIFMTEQQHNFIPFLADPATFLASYCVLETLFSSENSLFIQLLRG